MELTCKNERRERDVIIVMSHKSCEGGTPLRRANFSIGGCVNHASFAFFTQPLRSKYALQSTTANEPTISLSEEAFFSESGLMHFLGLSAKNE